MILLILIFCVSVISDCMVGITHDQVDNPLNLTAYGISVKDTSFLTVRFNPWSCGTNAVHLYQYDTIWSRRAFSLLFNQPTNYVQLWQHKDSHFTKQWYYVPDLMTLCFGTFWMSWKFDTFKFGKYSASFRIEMLS